MYQKTPYRSVDELLRIASSAYSRNAFSDILYFDDYRCLDRVDHSIKEIIGPAPTYMDVLKLSYRTMLKEYRGEYIYKNELINRWLLKQYGVQDTVYFNEFKIKNAIADIVMFNGESKAFEIKSELDSPKRLAKQIHVYTSIFDKCYIVVPESSVEQYMAYIPDTVGIVSLEYTCSKVRFNEKRIAKVNKNFDVDTLMQCLNTHEYENIIRRLDGSLPDVPGYDMYDACLARLMEADVQVLRKLWITEIKKRKSVSHILRHIPFEMRQACLSLNLTDSQSMNLIDKLQKTINI